ncbi:hypothetical protein IQ06DRAFT_309035 [Phaeosphaeriaceae sp. SRC1lsM3a]|nr:hypothetical protein IQ06DRAFT_309035 [Stagonospora sp. SRC1lsM3a]
MRLLLGVDLHALRPRPLCMDTPDMIMLVQPTARIQPQNSASRTGTAKGKPRRDTSPTPCLQRLSFCRALSSISTDAAWQTSAHAVRPLRPCRTTNYHGSDVTQAAPRRKHASPSCPQHPSAASHGAKEQFARPA